MRDGQDNSLSVTCRCGKVEFLLTGPPILAATCYCESCRRAGQAFEKLPEAAPVLDPDGGSPVILYRKDRVRCVAGQQHLESCKLKPDSPSRRVLATCCNTAMFGEFTKGHWVSLYRKRFSAGAPPLEMRIMTGDRRPDVVLRDDVPNHKGFSAAFAWKLARSWIAMGLRNPDMGLGQITESIFQPDPLS